MDGEEAVMAAQEIDICRKIDTELVTQFAGWYRFYFLSMPIPRKIDKEMRCKKCESVFYFKGCTHCGGTLINREHLRQTF
jgi:hypothetical protein